MAEFRRNAVKIKHILARRPFKALMIALLVGLVFGVAQIGEPLENMIELGRNKLRSHPASGSIVLIAIDDRSVGEIGSAHWNGSQLASLVRQADAAGARQIHLDDELDDVGTARQAADLESALGSARAQILLPARFSINPVSGARSDYLPPARFARHARLANTNLFVWWDDRVWQHPYAAEIGDRPVPSLSSLLGGADPKPGALFRIDYANDIRSIPMVSASDVLDHRIGPEQFAGKRVVIARTDIGVEHYRAPGVTLVPGILIHIAAAETILRGVPLDLGWPIPLAVALLLAAAVVCARRRAIAAGILALAVAAAIIAPLLLEIAGIHIQMLPPLAALLTAAVVRIVARLRRTYQTRGTINIVTGKPNLQALHQAERNAGIVVSARVANYAQITATLPPQNEKELVEQIFGRLEFGADGAQIYQADEGVFVWVARDDRDESIVQRIEGLQALFRSPIVVATRLIDLAVTFGLDHDASRPLAQRTSSALVAADEALRDGKRWASFNPATIKDADWAMSLLGRLDHAIDKKELWVAYQPKVDCKTGATIGAEALVRWAHPEKGQLPPDQFVGAAERGGRIDRLTYFVLDSALAAVARIQGRDPDFTMAVNLSVLLLSSRTLVPTVEALLLQHRVEPRLLTLEVTETSTLGSAEDQLANLKRLSDIGVQLSIDDYGTGFSTLEYLRRIPASEIKIDRSFIAMLCNSQSDRIMVNSTIQLAHSLGRKVVAEGVESQEILDELRRMGCDVIQGYHTGRPVPLAVLLKRLKSTGAQEAA
ncbi:MAG: EAL domain-containing protein [Alphaproteobacteria bacterium]|nr:MAG: EAL domain-containing protein [Alphaproteobacteria bacterium]